MRRIFLFLCFSTVLFSACKEELPIGPYVELKSGNGLISGDAIVGTNQTITVRTAATKTDIDMNLFYVEYAYDGASLPRLIYKKYVSGEEANYFEKEYSFTTRSTPGNERWIFNVNDDDGTITSVEIKLRVE
jgi:hypothetical protein